MDAVLFSNCVTIVWIDKAGFTLLQGKKFACLLSGTVTFTQKSQKCAYNEGEATAKDVQKISSLTKRTFGIRVVNFYIIYLISSLINL